jgi:CRISPR-associated protein Cmr3
MPTWIIEPRDPLVIRDGRPFGPDPGVRAESLAFPFPSTTTGGARNRFGLDGSGVFNRDRVAAVKGLAVRGPLLVELDAEERLTWYAPAPADALLVDAHEGHVQVNPLRPLAPPPGAATSVPGDLRPVGLAARLRAKPAGAAPQFWRWDAFAAWLARPARRIAAPAELGLGAMPRDARTHVSIADDSLTAAEGALFQTIGLAFVGPGRSRLGLAIEAAEPFPSFAGGLAPLAGERRLVTWRPSPEGLPPCPPAVREAIVRDGACRAVLLTPAFFAGGSRPGPLLAPSHGVTPALAAACMGRPQVVSGWDMERGQPKPTRRLAPAGAVYFLTLAGDAAARAAWVDAHWMACVSDDADGFTAGRDGFGLLALGAWDGSPVEMGGDDARS